jgi:hypothetical protein
MYNFKQNGNSIHKRFVSLSIRNAMTTKNYIPGILKTHKPELAMFGIQDMGLFGLYVRDEQSMLLS